MYPILLTLHSIVRWLVLILGVVVVVRAVAGWRGRQGWAPLDQRLGVLFSASLDVQLLLGLLLYLLFSPITTKALGDFGSAMSDPAARYWTVEHIALMFVAVVLAHVGWSLAKRRPDAAGKYRRASIFFGLAMLLILGAIPWPFLSYGRPLLRLG